MKFSNIAQETTKIEERNVNSNPQIKRHSENFIIG